MIRVNHKPRLRRLFPRDYPAPVTVVLDAAAASAVTDRVDWLVSVVEGIQARASSHPLDAWATEAELCARFRVSRRTMQRLRAAGEIPHSTLGGTVVYRVADVVAFLEGRCTDRK